MLIVAIGGTLRAGSSTEAAMRLVLRHAEALGAETQLFAGAQLDLPLYAPGAVSTSPAVQALVDAMRRADGFILGSPGYHGGVSGLVKNAIDYTEELARDAQPYFTAKPVACVASGAGFQGCNSALHALRSIAHALRGWPTPLGIAFNSATAPFGPDQACRSPEIEAQCKIMASELTQFIAMRQAATR